MGIGTFCGAATGRDLSAGAKTDGVALSKRKFAVFPGARMNMRRVGFGWRRTIPQMWGDENPLRL